MAGHTVALVVVATALLDDGEVIVALVLFAGWVAILLWAIRRVMADLLSGPP
jgi:hypothetical protein